MRLLPVEVEVTRLDRRNPLTALGQRFAWAVRDAATGTVLISGYAPSRRQAERNAEVHRRQREGT